MSTTIPNVPPLDCSCGGKLYLKTSRYGLFYGCVNWPNCTMRHGAHQATGKPLGKPADQETRNARIRAHEAFDPIWRSGTVDRSTAYDFMAKQLGIAKERCHIGEFDIATCEKVVRISNIVRQAKGI